MKAIIKKGKATGKIFIPASKSVAHRMLIAASFFKGKTEIHNLPENDDVAATADCLKKMGVTIKFEGRDAFVYGIGTDFELNGSILDCRESGTTLRLLLPCALVNSGNFTMKGSNRLFMRPLSVYKDICNQNGILWKQDENSVTLSGQLHAGNYSFPGNISSQFVSGLLLALVHANGKSTLKLTGKTESASYIALTIQALKMFGFNVDFSNGEYVICGNQTGVSPLKISVPTDQSSAAFFGALNALGGNVEFVDFYNDGVQGDRVWKEYMEKICSGFCEISLADCPDLAPVLMALAAANNGAKFHDTARLRFKESDRGLAMAKELKKMNVNVEIGENSITVGNTLCAPNEPLYGHNDHRIAMALAVLLTKTGGEIDDAQCVKKSLPEFWSMLKKLNVDVTLLNDQGELIKC